MGLTEQGVSTTFDKDCFRYEIYTSSIDHKKRVQWDYRDSAGVLHTGVTRDLPTARAAAQRLGWDGSEGFSW